MTSQYIPNQQMSIVSPLTYVPNWYIVRDMELRTARALHIAATTKLNPDNGRWKVPSQSGHGTYIVRVADDQSLACTCPDFEERLAPCKHVQAVDITIKREHGNGKPVPWSETVKVTYSQNWQAYNAAQTNEKHMFLSLLADLCATVPEPEHINGRPPHSMSTMSFATIYKVFERLSSRRFIGDLTDAHLAGLIDRVPSFNSVTAYMRSPEMTPILMDLVELSSLPLRAVEHDFAIDSSGFGTHGERTWFSLKLDRTITQREWRKVHLVSGVSTHVVAAASVTDSNANDSPQLPDLVRRTAKNFDVRELSADKGYSARANAAAIEEIGAIPFIAFKSNTVQPPEGSAWARMWHLYNYRRDDFLAHYHKRSNVETVFAMIKGRFGDTILARTPDGQTNEVLAKVVAHNICVLIKSHFDLGITAEFAEAV